MIPKFPNPKNPRDPDYVPEIIGHCENCGNELSPDWELWKDTATCFAVKNVPSRIMASTKSTTCFEVK